MTDSFVYDVFLSHSSRDKHVVRLVAERLRKDGLKVWFDEWVLKPGDNIPAKVEEGLEHSRVLVLCMSANAFGSDWAQLESGTFRFRDPLNKDRRFIPLRLDQTPIKGSLAQFLFISWLPEVCEEAYAKLLEACRPPAPTRLPWRPIFQDPLSDEWVIFGPRNRPPIKWSGKSGVLRGEGFGNLLSRLSFGDIVLTCRARILEATDDPAGLLLFVHQQLERDFPSGYHAWIRPDGLVVKQVTADLQPKVLKAHKGINETGKWMNVCLAAERRRLSIFIDNVAMANLDDCALNGGRIGIGTVNARIEVTDFNVDAPLPTA